MTGGERRRGRGEREAPLGTATRSANGPVRPALVVHVFAVDLARGAQVFARGLRNSLDGRPDWHRTLAIFAGEPAGLKPDVQLGVRAGVARRWGLDPRAAFALRRAVAALGVDVVVAHGGEALKYATTAALPRSVHLVYKKTGTSAESFRTRGQRVAYGLLARRVDVVAAVSRETADEARELLGVPASRVMLAPNGRDPSPFLSAPPRRTDGPPTLAFVGHLTRSKRPERFLAVVARLAGEGIDVRGTIIGDGPMAEALQAEAARLGVQLLGRRDDVPALLAGSDVLLLTGGRDGEGMPGVLIEAGLAGVPVIASAVSGASTVVDDGATGFVVPVDDFEALVGRARLLAVDPHLRARMGAAARDRCMNHFTLARSAAAWQAVIDRALGRGATAPVDAAASVASEANS